MFKRSITGCTFMAFAALCAMAQTSTTTMTATPAQEATRQVARLTKLLTLTSAQQALALPIFTTEETTEANLETSLTTARTALQSAIEKNDLNGINTQATQIGSLTTQQVAAQGKAEAAFYLLLTGAQQTIFNQLKLDAGGYGARGRH
jgi:hypothetical protein